MGSQEEAVLLGMWDRACQDEAEMLRMVRSMARRQKDKDKALAYAHAAEYSTGFVGSSAGFQQELSAAFASAYLALRLMDSLEG